MVVNRIKRGRERSKSNQREREKSREGFEGEREREKEGGRKRVFQPSKAELSKLMRLGQNIAGSRINAFSDQRVLVRRKKSTLSQSSFSRVGKTK